MIVVLDLDIKAGCVKLKQDKVKVDSDNMEDYLHKIEYLVDIAEVIQDTDWTEVSDRKKSTKRKY